MGPFDHQQVVFDIISRKTGIPISKLSLQQRLLQDLGIDGDDAAEVFIELSKVCAINLDTLQLEKYFRPEPNLFSVLRLPSSRRAELEEKLPVTIADLIHALDRGRW